MLEKDFNVRTLLVTEKSDEEEREAARRLDKPGSPYEAVVSVLMLRRVGRPSRVRDPAAAQVLLAGVRAASRRALAGATRWSAPWSW